MDLAAFTQVPGIVAPKGENPSQEAAYAFCFVGKAFDQRRLKFLPAYWQGDIQLLP